MRRSEVSADHVNAILQRAMLAAVFSTATVFAQGQHGAIRALTIAPAVARACPGDIVAAQYVARYQDGSSATLGRDAIATLIRRGDAVDARPDGSWEAASEPVYAAFTGYRLSASLAADSMIRADTTLAPAAQCRHLPIELGTSGRNDTKSAHVRVGTLITPFFDSVVVAVVEVEGKLPTSIVLTPGEMRSGVIRVNAPGANGRPGRGGRRGDNGDECQSGDSGEDGDPGEPGDFGGHVDIIVQADAPWLANLVAVSNPGGRGGRGGQGGQGGQGGSAGSRTRSKGNCSPKPGRPGRSGHDGPDGAAGPPPKTTTVPFSLLWRGSPIWSDGPARHALEQLMQYTAQRAR
jgi:hypothetical protein